MMMTDTTLKSKVDTILEKLPPEGQVELAQFLDILADKYQVEQTRNVIALGGIWKDTPLGVTDEELRKLRQDVTEHLMKKLDNELSS
jgi:hypothetical protein